MVHTVNVHEAKSTLSRLLQEVEAGHEVVIARAGKPVARLVPADQPREPRVPGAWRGRLWIADDFDDTGPALLTAFTGADLEPRA